MKRTLSGLLALLSLLAVARAAPLDGEKREATLRYIHQLQNEDGGFRSSAIAGASSLGATASCLRALNYLGAVPRHRQKVIESVRSCYDRSTGGFVETPGGTSDVRSTAMGLMAAAALAVPLDEWGKATTAYFTRHARRLADIYLAEAALDATGLKPPHAREWLAAFKATRNAEGTYGTGAFDTAGAVVTILRLDGEVKQRDAVVRALKAAQRPDGGFSAARDTADLATTYRMMRAFWMLKEKPHLGRLRE
ncbi:MAG: peptidase, partial [Armatimonadetes bacterium]|nr:peptidase [Armatimonadota bacterium]